MNKRIKILIFISLMLMTGVLYSQPYKFYSELSRIDTSASINQRTFKITYVNLRTGEDKLFCDGVFSDVFLVDQTVNWIITGDFTSGYNAKGVKDTGVVIVLPDNIIPHVIRYSNTKNKLYIIGNNRYSDSSETKKLCVLDITAKRSITERTLPRSTYEYYSPFFSEDESKLYFTSNDSLGAEYNDNTCVTIFSTETNLITNKILLRNIGYPDAGYYTMLRGRKGKGIIVSDYKTKADKYYQIYDFEKGTSSAFVHSTVNADAYMLGEDCRYLALVELKKGLIGNSDPYDVPSGIVKIFDAKTGQLLKTLTYPEETAIVFYDDYPNDIYPLGVEVNGVVSKFSIEGLKKIESNDMNKDNK
jgi:hypothetical protein